MGVAYIVQVKRGVLPPQDPPPMYGLDLLISYLQILGQVDKKFIACMLNTTGTGEEYVNSMQIMR